MKQFKIQNYSAGFTLIELLVVILVIFSVGVLIASVLFSALRGANKTSTIDTVRKNGNSAITQMSRMIRYSQSFNGVSIDGTPGSYTTNCSSPIAASFPVISAPSPRLGFFSRIASLIQGFGNLGKREVSGLFSKLASIPQSFTSKRTPRREVAAAISTQNLGYTTAEINSLGTSNRIRVSRITVPDAKSGVVSQGSMYIKGSTNNATVYMVVYNDNGSLLPGNLIAVSSGVSVLSTQVAGWVNFTFPTQFSISTNQNIWIGMYADITGTTGGTNGPSLYYSVFVVGDYASDSYVYKDHGDAPVPNPFGTGTDTTAQRSWSAYLIVNPPPTLTPTPPPTPTPTPTHVPTPTPPPPTPTPTPVGPTPTPTPLTKYPYVKITSFDGFPTVFRCLPSDATAPIASNGASLVDVNSVSVSSCYFTCSQDNIFSPPNIGINFSLTQKGNPQFFEKKDSVNFQTSVSIRNF